MSRTLARTAAAAVIAASVAAATVAAVPALAATPTPTTSGGDRLAAIQARAKMAIDARESALSLAVSDVKANRFISPTDKSTLLNTLTSDQSGLSSLEQKIQADTAVVQAEADYRTIFTGYRVFALAVPQVRYAAACDDLTGGVLTRLSDAQSKLQALLAGPDKDKTTPAVQAAMQDLANQIKTITSSTNGLSAQVLAITPAQWDADHNLLAQPKQALRAARGDARTARQDIQTVVQAIKS